MTMDQYDKHLVEHFRDYTYDMFMLNMSPDPEEVDLFDQWVRILKEKGRYPFELPRTSSQQTGVSIKGPSNAVLNHINMSSYNYLGLSYHPDVIAAAQQAVAQYGLGACSSPVISGTFELHQQLEKELLQFFKLQDTHGISLFSSGYGVNLGTVQAFAKPGSVVLIDDSAHMSILEGAKLSGAKIDYFKHNDMKDLEKKLETHCDGFNRVLVCTEGVYSADGDYGRIGEIVKLTKRFDAYSLIDEAHSVLLAGENGRGVSEMHGVLDQVDLYVMTFSKAFGGVGGALMARTAITQYTNWYAKCRMFSCALDPAVTGGMIKALQIAGSEEGAARRRRIRENATYMKSLLNGHVELGISDSWILTVLYGNDRLTLDVASRLHEKGLDTSLIQFPAVKKNEGRIRLFITSEHTTDQMDRAADIIISTASEMGFGK